MTARPITIALGDLGSRLRELRDAAGLTGVQLAETLGGSWRPPKISKIENGRQLPTDDEIGDWVGATGGDPEPLRALRERAAAEYRSHREAFNRSGGAVGHQRDLTDLMESCTYLAEFQPALVPGRLQTAAYIREVIGLDPFHEDEDDPAGTLQRIIAAKVRRQAILYEPGREFVHVVTEAALRLRIGALSPTTLRAQLFHLAELATLPGHTFGVIPFSSPCPAMPLGFSFYDRDLVQLESNDGVVGITDPGQVARYARWLDQLVAVALTGEEAAAFCREVAGSLLD